MAGVHMMITTLGAAIGMAISILLLLLLRRQSERQSERFAGILLGTVVLLMYASISVSSSLTMGEASEHDWRYFIGFRALVATAAFILPVIFFGWRVSPIFEGSPPIGTLLFRFSIISGIATAVFIWCGPSSIMTDKLAGRVLAWNAVIFLLPGFYLLLRKPLSPQLRLCMKVTGTFYFVGLIAALAITSSIKKPSLLYTSLSLVQEMCILVGILGSFIFMARFRFADVFVKWSLRLVGLGLLATLGALAITTSTTIGIVNPAYRVLIDTMVLFGSVALAITATPAIDNWAERWVLQQADFKGQLVRFISGMADTDSEPDLLSWIDTQLVACLQVKSARTIRRAALPEGLTDELSMLGDALDSCRIRSSWVVDELAHAETLMPIMVDGKMRYALAICPRAGRSTLLSGEIQFLRAVATQVGVRIHQIEAEHASRHQALQESLLREQLAEAELRALRAQVNPHFLFNSLNTIADFIVTNPPNAERMTLRLASIFRHVLAQSQRQFTSLHEEFDFLRNYLQIEQERFGDRLSVNMSLDPAIAQTNIPTLLLQPIVENALKHGLAPKDGTGRLHISAALQGSSILLTVCDDGVGFEEKHVGSPETALRPSGVGLTNTIARLQTMYGSRASLNIKSAPYEGCRVSISYPTQVPLYALSHY